MTGNESLIENKRDQDDSLWCSCGTVPDSLKVVPTTPVGNAFFTCVDVSREGIQEHAGFCYVCWGGLSIQWFSPDGRPSRYLYIDLFSKAAT